jgi:hypothetical protein
VNQEDEDSSSEMGWDSDKSRSEKEGKDTPEDSEGGSNGDKDGEAKKVRFDLTAQV